MEDVSKSCKSNWMGSVVAKRFSNWISTEKREPSRENESSRLFSNRASRSRSILRASRIAVSTIASAISPSVEFPDKPVPVPDKSATASASTMPLLATRSRSFRLFWNSTGFTIAKAIASSSESPFSSKTARRAAASSNSISAD